MIARKSDGLQVNLMEKIIKMQDYDFDNMSRNVKSFNNIT